MLKYFHVQNMSLSLSNENEKFRSGVRNVDPEGPVSL